MSKDWLDEQEFYELMQAYRHAPLTDPPGVVQAFEDVKAAIRSAARTAPGVEERAEAAARITQRILDPISGPLVALQTTQFDAIESLRATIQAAVANELPDLAPPEAGAMRALESLTPGGSEFVGDPEACRKYAAERLANTQVLLKAAVQGRKESGALREAAKFEIGATVYRWGKGAPDKVIERAYNFDKSEWLYQLYGGGFSYEHALRAALGKGNKVPNELLCPWCLQPTCTTKRECAKKRRAWEAECKENERKEKRLAELRKQAKSTPIPLRDAMLCESCQTITASHNDHCTHCSASGASLVSLSRILNRGGEPSKAEQKHTPLAHEGAASLSKPFSDPHQNDLPPLTSMLGGPAIFQPGRTNCMWCKEPLHYVLGRGWVHADGLLYAQRLEHGQYVDDHCALPAAQV